MTTRAAADRAIADMMSLTVAEAGRSQREVHQLFLSAGGLSPDREQQAAALLSVRRDLGLDDSLLRLASDVSQADRMAYAKKGWALPDGSYPIPDVEHLKAAAVLCRSRHGDWKAAGALIAKRARELNVPNPLTSSSDVAATSYQARRLARAGLAPDDILLSRTGDTAVTYDQTSDDEIELAAAEAELSVILTRQAGIRSATSRALDLHKVAVAGNPRSRPARLPGRLYDDQQLDLTRTREDDAAALEATAAAADAEIARLTASSPDAARYFKPGSGSSSAGRRRQLSSGEAALRTPGCEAEIARLTASAHLAGYFDADTIALARHDLRSANGSYKPVPAIGHSSNPLVHELDARPPSDSDLSGRVSLYDQSPEFPDFSPKAEAEYVALPDAVRSDVQDELDQADACDDPPGKTFHLLRAASHTASAGTAHHLHHEIHARVRAVTDSAASYVPTAEDAGRTVAGGRDMQDEIDRLSSLNTVGSSGNRSDPPKSAAQRQAETARARPGHG